MLDPRTIAVQGVNMSPRLVAVQGLWPSQSVVISAGFRGARRVFVRDRLRDDDEMLLLIAAMAIVERVIH